MADILEDLALTVISGYIELGGIRSVIPTVAAEDEAGLPFGFIEKSTPCIEFDKFFVKHNRKDYEYFERMCDALRWEVDWQKDSDDWTPERLLNLVMIYEMVSVGRYLERDLSRRIWSWQPGDMDDMMTGIDQQIKGSDATIINFGKDVDGNIDELAACIAEASRQSASAFAGDAVFVMRPSLYYEIKAEGVLPDNVTVDPGIFERNALNSELKPGQFSSNLYLLPIKADDEPVLRMEYRDQFSVIYSGDDFTFWTDAGVYRWTVKQDKWSTTLLCATEQRIVCDRLDAAVVVADVIYEPLEWAKVQRDG